MYKCMAHAAQLKAVSGGDAVPDLLRRPFRSLCTRMTLVLGHAPTYHKRLLGGNQG